jgi:nicotinate dehydrogenase subunit A
MEQTFRLTVNGATQSVRCEAETPVLYALRNDLALNGPKFGCGLGQCGSCTVLLDGKEARSCVLPVSSVKGAHITTLEGLAPGKDLHPLQRAFLEEQAAQCGYCTGGMILAAKALLDENRDPSAQQVREALDGHLCRCGTHNRIVKAVLRAAKELA